MINIYPQYYKAKANFQDWFIKISSETDDVMVGSNTSGLNDVNTLIARKKDFLLHNNDKNKCLKVVVDKPELLHCGTGGNVSFVSSDQQDPNLAILKRNPGSVENPAENGDPCGPLLADNVPFMFRKDSPVSDLIVSYKIN